MNSEKTKFNSEKIHFIQTDQLKENELNKFKLWSGDTYNTISASIQSKGILVPLIIRDDSTILDGHNRWRVAIELGIEKLPCIIAPKFQNSLDEKAFIDIVQNARRQLTKRDWYEMILRDYGHLIHVDRRGKRRKGVLSDDGIKDISTTISKASGIPRTTVHNLIKKARKQSQSENLTKGNIKINFLKLEEYGDTYREYLKLIEKRSEIRRKIEIIEKELMAVADIKTFEEYFNKK
jgi:hypothetical protein